MAYLFTHGKERHMSIKEQLQNAPERGKEIIPKTLAKPLRAIKRRN